MILEQAKRKLQALAEARSIDDQEIAITCKILTPEEAIGNPLHDDYPIQLGKERLIEAVFMEKKGQAFSDAYFNYTGSVRDILSLRLDTTARRAIFVSSLNAILAGLGEMPQALHCRNDDLTRCGDFFSDFLFALAPQTDKALLVGLQPRLLESLTAQKQVRVCDLNPDNIGVPKCGVCVDGPDRFPDNAQWADVIFATGSTVVNGTVDDIIDTGRNTYFYGVTIAGIAHLLGLKHFCYIIQAR